jgi:glycosyltransferase involved in cell wall biosynthesis
MKISVVIPTYNSETFIRTTLDSVLRQTVEPDEILVLDDGSIDNTVSLLNSYKPRIDVFQQRNKGVADARNSLCAKAQGDLIAFLDHDDIWHPSYLEMQSRLYRKYPQAVAFFTGHVDFYGYGSYNWSSSPPKNLTNIELMSPLSFIKRYNKTTGHFASMSYCCIPKRALIEIGPEPFCVTVSGADDYCLFNVLPLFGSIIYASVTLVAYRITNEAQSENLLKSLALSLNALELLEGRYKKLAEVELCKAFKLAFASRRRQYAKILMGATKTLEARRQLLYSLQKTCNASSLAKSLALLFLTYMPVQFQPKWPSGYRE